jgi:hypothetical protein
MAIDIHEEDLLEIDEAPRRIPQHRGRPVHISTIYRWSQKGVRGVRLETALIGGRAYTSAEALDRFFDRLNAGRNGETNPQHRSPARRQREAAAAGERLAKAGY